MKRFDVEIEARNPGKIIFSIGNNDSVDIVFTGLTPVDEDKTTPIPWSVDKSYKNLYIKTYNDKIKEICDKEKIKFIDLYNSFMNLKNYKEFLEDGLHPTSEGHQFIFEIIKQNLF